jgi:hypothetical protein
MVYGMVSAWDNIGREVEYSPGIECHFFKEKKCSYKETRKKSALALKH